jgi:hypothetical protein
VVPVIFDEIVSPSMSCSTCGTMGKRGARLMMKESGKCCLHSDKGSVLLTKATSSQTSHDHLLSSPVRVNKLSIRSA